MLSLRPEVIELMIADSADRQPSEAVGILGGTDMASATKCIPLPNMLTGLKYWADPYAQWTALRALKESGLIPVAVYHSHPDGGVTLSAEDVRFARHAGLIQIVVSLRNRHVNLAAYEVGVGGDVHGIQLRLG